MRKETDGGEIEGLVLHMSESEGNTGAARAILERERERG